MKSVFSLHNLYFCFYSNISLLTMKHNCQISIFGFSLLSFILTFELPYNYYLAFLRPKRCHLLLAPNSSELAVLESIEALLCSQLVFSLMLIFVNLSCIYHFLTHSLCFLCLRFKFDAGTFR